MNNDKNVTPDNDKSKFLTNLSNIMNAIGDPIFVKDAESKFLFANDALCKILGMERKNILGKTLGESLPKDQMDLFLKNDRMVLETGEENISEEPLTGKGGKILTIITKKTRYVDEQENKYLVAVIHDITKQKEAEKEVEEKITELQNMNRIMIGRELTMADMKKEIEKLKKQIP